ncbi:MAG: hypothetical protein QM820_62450 [Minicystis sp.]
MSQERPAGRAARRTVDRDGVVEVRDRQGDRTGWILLGGVAALLVAGALVKVRERFAPGPQPAAATAASARAGRRAAPIAVTPAPAVPGRPMDSDPGDSPPENPAAMAAGEPQNDSGEAPVREGIAVFPAPGTKPIKVGIIVPDDFPLPPGYVRHYQTTDKGQMLPAILMFHPDHPPAGADGKPISIPEDRIVPPDMAPAGLPAHLLEVPKDAYADREEEGREAPR